MSTLTSTSFHCQKERSSSSMPKESITLTNMDSKLSVKVFPPCQNSNSIETPAISCSRVMDNTQPKPNINCRKTIKLKALNVEINKDWQHSVSFEQRCDALQKFVQEISPLVYHRNIGIYARKVEGRMFQVAGSDTEYFKLLNERARRIQKELKHRRKVMSLEKQCSNWCIES